MYLSSFDEVVRRYERTAPVVSKFHLLEDDIRPIGDRRKKHERIKKLSKNCYVLIGGYYRDGVSYWGPRHETSEAPTKTQLMRTAPMVWERRSDGDYLTIHNTYHSYNNAWRGFLRRHLPRGLDVSYTYPGRSALPVRIGTGLSARTVPVPLNRYAPRKWFQASSYYSNSRGLVQNPKAEERLVLRTNNDGRFTVVEATPMPKTKAKFVVDRETKKKMSGPLNEFKGWVRDLYPVMYGQYTRRWNLPSMHTSINELHKTNAAYFEQGRASHVGMGSTGSVIGRIALRHRRAAIKRNDHELRPVLLLGFAHHLLGHDYMDEYECAEEKRRAFERHLNKYVNGIAGLYVRPKP